MEIQNDTVDLYRYFDLTLQTEFLFDCVRETIEQTIPAEIDYLIKYDRLFQQINEVVSLPDNRVDLLIKLLKQGKGQLSKKKWAKAFTELSAENLANIEAFYGEVFGEES